MILHFTLKFFELLKCFRLVFHQVDILISAQIICEDQKIMIPSASLSIHRTTYISIAGPRKLSNANITWIKRAMLVQIWIVCGLDQCWNVGKEACCGGDLDGGCAGLQCCPYTRTERAQRGCRASLSADTPCPICHPGPISTGEGSGMAIDTQQHPWHALLHSSSLPGGFMPCSIDSFLSHCH